MNESVICRNNKNVLKYLFSLYNFPLSFMIMKIEEGEKQKIKKLRK